MEKAPDLQQEELEQSSLFRFNPFSQVTFEDKDLQRLNKRRKNKVRFRNSV